MTDNRQEITRNGFTIKMEFRDDGTPRNGRHMVKTDGVLNSWWLSKAWGDPRRYEVTQKFWISGPNRGETLRFVFDPEYRFDGPTLVDSRDWRSSLWWPFAAAHDQPYKENQLYSRVWRNSDNVGTLGNRARVDEFFRDGLLAWGEPAALVWPAYYAISAGGSLVWGKH